MIPVKIKNYVKNGSKLGFYLYIPIVKIENEFWTCETIKSKTILKKNTVDMSLIIPKRIIEPQFYNANGLI